MPNLRTMSAHVIVPLAVVPMAAYSGSSQDNRDAFDTDKILDIAHRGGNVIASEATDSSSG